MGPCLLDSRVELRQEVLNSVAQIGGALVSMERLSLAAQATGDSHLELQGKVEVMMEQMEDCMQYLSTWAEVALERCNYVEVDPPVGLAALAAAAEAEEGPELATCTGDVLAGPADLQEQQFVSPLQPRAAVPTPAACTRPAPATLPATARKPAASRHKPFGQCLRGSKAAKMKEILKLCGGDLQGKQLHQPQPQPPQPASLPAYLTVLS